MNHGYQDYVIACSKIVFPTRILNNILSIIAYLQIGYDLKLSRMGSILLQFLGRYNEY